MALPMPRELPVTTATFSAKSIDPIIPEPLQTREPSERLAVRELPPGLRATGAHLTAGLGLLGSRPVDPKGEVARLRDVDRPFDPDLASYRLRELPIDRIVDLLQVTHDPETVMAYREAMRQGAKFPPISVVSFAGRGVVADGHKRLTAYKGLCPDPIVVEVWPWRRLVGHLANQLLRSLRRCLRITARAPWTIEGRAEARRLLRDTAVHWQRTVVSLAARLRGRA